ncbi:MAG: universal stress protein, partial [Thermodesulfovibrio sp.]|nr:universal stress protein [Thermodesulfovibrio sp.]
GTLPRSGVERFFVGSTTQRVIRNAPCPVLVVTKKQ